ncbi:MAG: ribosome-associated translation inhibitor RaiA [Rickettsiales bacterium]|nr:MAG: ribosome-associated translation inhibitor RaiA [Rickettsiales bacterium]
MQLQISGQHISIGASLQTYVDERTKLVVSKYFAEAPNGHIHFTKQGYKFLCDIVIHEGTGRHMIIKSNATSDDIYSAFDISLSKLEKQLRKYKSKLNDYSKRVKLSEVTSEATKYIISPESNNDTEEFNIDNPAIVAEKPLNIMTLSVGEAVMRMDFENLPALMFKNSKTDRMNVVYYRRDGNISWVDSK